jgi:chromosome segregation ATPase
LRKSFDSLAEERNARQALENNYKFQIENVLQLNGRLKRAEDSLNEDRSAMQSLIAYTRNLEQNTAIAQKDLFVRRDYQAQRLEELRIQIDDLSRSKENLERSAFSLLEEIKTLKSKVDIETINLNSVSGDLRNKTRRLEDENRQQVIRNFCKRLFGLFKFRV